MTTIICTQVSTNRSTPRIWLEGLRLARGQFTPEARYSVTRQGDQVILTLCADGKRKVSQRSQKPVIDLCAKVIAEWFPVGEKLRAVIRKGKIVIRRLANTTKALLRDRRLLAKLRSGQPLDMVSMFSGGGVMDRALHDGFARAGIRTRTMVSAELEGTYMDANLRANACMHDDQSVFINGPVQDIDLGKATKASIMACGLPCTGFSSSGKARRKLVHAEAHPESGALFFTFLSWVQAFQPAIIVLENVKAMLTSASMEVIRSTLGAWSYSLYETVINGCDFGALENRDRAVVICMSKDLAAHGGFDLGDIKPLQVKPASLSEALDPTIGEDDSRWTIHEYLERKAITDAKAGKGFARQLFDGSEPHISVVTRQYQKVRSTDPHIKHPTLPRVTRLLTPAEHARVKGLPEGWIESCELADSRAHEVLGQSIIFPAFEAVGAALGENLQALNKIFRPSTPVAAINDAAFNSNTQVGLAV